MVLAAKIFQVREEVDIDTVAAKLKDFRAEEPYEYDGQRIDLLTEVKDLKMAANSLEGVLAQDQILTVFHRGKFTPTPKTTIRSFILNEYGDRMLLTILEKKQKANSIANQISKILFITTGHIVEARMHPETLKSFHEQNFEDTKVIFFDDVDMPNINKLSLYGSELGNTSLYIDYLSHGKLWYTVVRSKKYGYIVGVTRNCVVTVFSKIDASEFLAYISNEIFPLIS